MKKFVLAMVCAGMLVCNSPASAATAFDLSGNEYSAYIICSTDLGDYCDQGKIKTDTFIFDGDQFGMGFFGDGLESLLSGGEFDASVFSFDAQYTGLDDLDRYTFDLNGITILDTILFGTMDIEYEQNGGLFGDEADGKAFFFAIKK